MFPTIQQQSNLKKTNMYAGNKENYYANGHLYSQPEVNMGVQGPCLLSNRQRFAPYPYYKRSYANALMQPNQRYYGYQMQPQQKAMASSNLVTVTNKSMMSPTDAHGPNSGINGFGGANLLTDTPTSANSFNGKVASPTSVTLQISNLDTSIEENEFKQYLSNRLKPIATVLSIYFESLSVAKIKLPSDYEARQVISYLHRRKIGHKRITVSYTRESSTLDSSTLRCQVAGLLKDIPNYKLSMYKFRELFQSRFKTSISVVDLHEMKDICTVIGNKNEEFITLRAELVESIENSELVECFQQSVPYCSIHFVKNHRGWAEQEIDPLPNVQMTIPQVREIIFGLLKNHKSVIPIASIVHCIQSTLNVNLDRNENGVNFEHLISCVQGVQITSNKFSIKILSISNDPESSPKDKDAVQEDMPPNRYMKYDSFTQVKREIIELVKMSPKSTLKFSRFIPAYHNHFGKQCRVADYGYTKLIDLFEALSTDVQVMGEGENRQITLTHRVQMQRFKTDLMRILRTQSTKSILLSHVPMVYEQVQGRKFNITDYGVCDVNDILEALIKTNVVVVTAFPHMMDTLISIPKRKQSTAEVEKTSNFAAEVVELFKHASQYTILFEKFACSYHYHFGYQCRLSDYGFLKLADLMEAISGIVEMEFSNEEDRKISLSPKIAQRIFSEQLKELVESYSGSSDIVTNLHEILIYHKKQYGYQIVPQSLGYDDMLACIKSLPYVEVITTNGFINIKCHHDDVMFRRKSYAAVRILLEADGQNLPFTVFAQMFADKHGEVLTEHLVKTMKQALEIVYINNVKYVTITKMMRFIVHIINYVEAHGVVKIYEIANSLKFSIKECFPFGYPNLSSLIQAFPDIFEFLPSKINNVRNEIKINNQCILAKNFYLKVENYLLNNDNNNNKNMNNNNNNNNEANAIDYYKMVDASLRDNSSDLMSMDSEFGGAASLALQNSLNTSVSSASLNGFMDINIHSSFQSMNNSMQYNKKNEFDVFNALNSTKMSSDSSFNNSDNTSGKETEKKLFKGDEIMEGYGDKLTPSNRDNNWNLCGLIQNAFQGKDTLSSRKRKFFGDPPKPDTPPTTPYWNNPIWSDEDSPPVNIKIEIPDLKVINFKSMLHTPLVLANISKKHKFSFTSQNE